MRTTTFAEILEQADEFPPEEQETLIRILQNRLRDQHRAERLEMSNP